VPRRRTTSAGCSGSPRRRRAWFRSPRVSSYQEWYVRFARSRQHIPACAFERDVFLLENTRGFVERPGVKLGYAG
jgi:hypothetical protein